MAIRIDRIFLAKGGPLEKAFGIEPGDINLIYGQNETGKTYIVESLISLLFRTGRKSTVEWGLRNWDFSGKVIVSGISNKTVIFSKPGKKLDDFWQEDIGLPRDLSRLLVVKAGETMMVRNEDGVGHELLRSYLSGEGILGNIEARIPATLRNTIIENGQLNGPNMGDIKYRNELIASLERVKILMREVEEAYASGKVYYLRESQEKVNIELDALKKAKRHYAASLSKKRQILQEDIEKLPTEEELSRIESDISVCESKKIVIENKSDTLSGLRNMVDNYVWTEKALGVYKELMTEKNASRPRRIYFILALVSMLVALVTGLLHLNIPLAIFVVGALASSILYYVSTRNALMSTGNSSEMQNLKLEYKNRYGVELTGRAALETNKDKLQTDYFRALSLAKELEEQLKPQFQTDVASIKWTLHKLTGKDLPLEEWRSIISATRTELKRLGSDRNAFDVALASLAIPEADFLAEDPGTKWDNNRYDKLKKEATDTENATRDELEKLNNLRTRIVQETHLESSDWEDLINALRNKQAEIQESYRQLTAQILAKLQVYTVIKDFRTEEDVRIAEGLKSEELAKPLQAFTGHYKSVQYEEDSGLILTTNQEEQYPLNDISTGAKEQVLLALRIGFSSIAMRGQTAFLILDDAFQHSDWQRRDNLVGQTIKLADSGWQIFYFTMDEHIRGLYLDKSKRFGDKFKSIELG